VHKILLGRARWSAQAPTGAHKAAERLCDSEIFLSQTTGSCCVDR
jgi:hypothetical protein